MDCLNEAVVLALVQGQNLAADIRGAAEHHLGSCPFCAEVLAYARLTLGAQSPAVGVGMLRLPQSTLGQYALGPELARGGMGRIVAARDLKLSRPVALKFALSIDRAMTARFVREVSLASRLEHPAIVPIYDAGILPDGVPFYAMPWIGGEPLDRAIDRATTISERLALVPHVLTVADAMAYVHTQDVIHRDIKPQNIMLGEFGQTVLLDWGLAKDLAARDDEPAAAPAQGRPLLEGERTTAQGMLLGTPAYMGPEQLAGAVADQRADVYGLGATLYHVLTGAAPKCHRSQALSSLAKQLRTPGIPPELAAIVVRAMAPDPLTRYQSAREFAGDLRRFLTGRLVEAHSYSLRQRLARLLRRHRAAVAVGVAAMTLLVMLSGLSLRRIARERRATIAAREQAELERDAAQGLVSFVIEDLRARLARFGRLDLLADTSAQVLSYYHKLRPVAGRHETADRSVLTAMEVLGEAQLAAGQADKAIGVFRDALAMARSASDKSSSELWTCRLQLALSDALSASGNTAASTPGYTECHELAMRRLAEAPREPAWRLCLVQSSVRLAESLFHHGDAAGARAMAQEAIAVSAPLRSRAADPEGLGWQAALKAGNYLTQWTIQARDWKEAQAHADRLLTAATGFIDAWPDDIKSREIAAAVYSTIGQVAEHQGDHKRAAAAYQTGQQSSAALVAREPANSNYQRQLGVASENLGRLALLDGHVEEAQGYYVASRDASAKLAAASPHNADLGMDLGISETDLGDLARDKRHDAAGARAAYQRALAALERARADAPYEPRIALALGLTLGHLGELEDEEGHRGAARMAYQRSVAVAREGVRLAPSPESHFVLAEALRAMAEVDPRNARALLGEALELVKPLRQGAARDDYLPAFLADLDAAARRVGAAKR